MKPRRTQNRTPNIIVVNAKDNAPAEILIYDDIGPDWLGMIGSKTIAQALKDLGNPKEITVRLNSPGGSVFEGVAIYNQFKNHKATINMEIDSLAASIASIIAMAGDQIRIAGNAMMMIHDPMAVTWGNAEEMQKTVDLLKQVKDNMLIPTYAARTGEKTSPETLGQLMTEETWFSAEEAVEAGLADEVSANKEVSAYVDTEVFGYKHVPEKFTDPKAAGQLPELDEFTLRNLAERRLELAARTS